jgi:hypothetical protein
MLAGVCENAPVATVGLPMQLRNPIILVLSQLISAAGSIVFVTLGGIIGSTPATHRALATLPCC